MEADASIWYGAVPRGDCAPIVIRAGANVQDNSVLHGPPDVLNPAYYRELALRHRNGVKPLPR